MLNFKMTEDQQLLLLFFIERRGQIKKEIGVDHIKTSLQIVSHNDIQNGSEKS